VKWRSSVACLRAGEIMVTPAWPQPTERHAISDARIIRVVGTRFIAQLRRVSLECFAYEQGILTLTGQRRGVLRRLGSYFSKNGNSFASSVLLGRRPYSQISNASAYCTFSAFSGPYHSTRESRYFFATP